MWMGLRLWGFYPDVSVGQSPQLPKAGESLNEVKERRAGGFLKTSRPPQIEDYHKGVVFA